MAGSSTLKAYKKLSNLYTFYEAETNCRADGAWIATPRTSADLTDIQGNSSKDHITTGDSVKDIINVSIISLTVVHFWLGVLNIQNKIVTTNTDAESLLEYQDGTALTHLQGGFWGGIMNLQKGGLDSNKYRVEHKKWR